MILTLKVRLAKGEVQDLELKFISNQEFGCAEKDDLLMQSSVWLKSAAEVQAAAEKAAADKVAATEKAAEEKAAIRNGARALSMYLPYLSIQSIDNTFYHTQCVVFSRAENE